MLLLLLHLRLFGLHLVPLGGKHVEIDGDRIIHVEKRGLEGGGQGVLHLPGLLFHEEALQLGLDQGLYDAIEHQRITTDVPSRLQPEPCMGAADGGHGIGIIRVECARGDPCPVFELHGLGVLYMRVVREELRGLRHRTDLRIKTIERGIERAGDDALHV
ncbi:hypothetical protein D3C72_1826230 [compost metagenome]